MGKILKKGSCEKQRYYQTFLIKKAMQIGQKQIKSSEKSELLYCIGGGDGGTRTLDLTDVNRTL